MFSVATARAMTTRSGDVHGLLRREERARATSRAPTEAKIQSTGPKLVKNRSFPWRVWNQDVKYTTQRIANHIPRNWVCRRRSRSIGAIPASTKNEMRGVW